jgi:hypothetical protein
VFHRHLLGEAEEIWPVHEPFKMREISPFPHPAASAVDTRPPCNQSSYRRLV